MSYPLSHTVVNKNTKKEKKKRTIEINFRGQSRTVSNINIRTYYQLYMTAHSLGLVQVI